jgi:branched-chain amino acid transport system permease protein
MEFFTLVLQQILNGLVLGAIYAIVAVGLALVYGILYQANFAHCEQTMLAGYVLFFSLTAGIPFPIAAIFVFVTGIVLGSFFYRLVWLPTMEKPHIISVLVFFGVSIALESLVMAFYSPLSQRVQVPFFGVPLSFYGLTITQGRLLAIILSVVLLVSVYLFVAKTRMGTAALAIAQDLRAAQLVGIDIRLVGLVIFILGGMLAAAAALLVYPIYGFVSPAGGFMLVLRAFLIIVMGGLANIPGTIAASFALGLLESLLSGLVWSDLKDLVPWVLLIVVLWVRPEGLFGKTVRRAG